MRQLPAPPPANRGADPGATAAGWRPEEGEGRAAAWPPGGRLPEAAGATGPVPGRGSGQSTVDLRVTEPLPAEAKPRSAVPRSLVPGVGGQGPAEGPAPGSRGGGRRGVWPGATLRAHAQAPASRRAHGAGLLAPSSRREPPRLRETGRRPPQPRGTAGVQTCARRRPRQAPRRPGGHRVPTTRSAPGRLAGGRRDRATGRSEPEKEKQRPGPGQGSSATWARRQAPHAGTRGGAPGRRPCALPGGDAEARGPGARVRGVRSGLSRRLQRLCSRPRPPAKGAAVWAGRSPATWQDQRPQAWTPRPASGAHTHGALGPPLRSPPASENLGLRACQLKSWPRGDESPSCHLPETHAGCFVGRR